MRRASGGAASGMLATRVEMEMARDRAMLRRESMDLEAPAITEDHGALLRAATRHLDPVREAALYIQDAITYSTHTLPRPGELARRLHLAHLFLQPAVRWALLLLVLFTFLELPAWCATDPACKASLRGGTLTGAFASGDLLYPLFAFRNETIVYPMFGTGRVPHSLVYPMLRAESCTPLVYLMFAGLPILHLALAS